MFCQLGWVTIELSSISACQCRHVAVSIRRNCSNLRVHGSVMFKVFQRFEATSSILFNLLVVKHFSYWRSTSIVCAGECPIHWKDVARTDRLTRRISDAQTVSIVLTPGYSQIVFWIIATPVPKCPTLEAPKRNLELSPIS